MESNSANVSNSTFTGNLVQGDTTGSISTTANHPEKQLNQQEITIKEAVTEITRILEQLEQSNPSATETEQLTYVNIAIKPDLKQRVVAALKAGGETLIDEFVLENKYLKVGKSLLKGWFQQ
jgi:hypothetical protein